MLSICIATNCRVLEHIFPIPPVLRMSSERAQNLVPPSIMHLCNHCRSVLNRLVWLGYLYRELEAFSSHAQGIGPDALGQSDADGRGSMYQRALATGLAEVLAVYRSAILQLEQDALSEVAPVLSTVMQAMHQVRGGVGRPPVGRSHVSEVAAFVAMAIDLSTTLMSTLPGRPHTFLR